MKPLNPKDAKNAKSRFVDDDDDDDLGLPMDDFGSFDDVEDFDDDDRF